MGASRSTRPVPRKSSRSSPRACMPVRDGPMCGASKSRRRRSSAPACSGSMDDRWIKQRCYNLFCSMDNLKSLIREVPDFPKPGILFYDITTLLKDKSGLAASIDGLKAHYAAQAVDVVLGIEARGFIFAPALAY